MKEAYIDSYIKLALTDYGTEVNTNRHIASINDGLKPVYRRVINSGIKMQGKMVKTATLVGDVIGTTHPHGDTSVSDVISALVRHKIFDGQGNHGLKMIYGEDIQPSHMRYTEAKLNDGWYDIFKELMPYVPYKEAEISGNQEPEYLPTPIPLILLFSGLGIGYGANARYPFFTAKSLFNAYINDDPNLLEAPGDLILDHQQSELKELWESGLGRITYKYRLNEDYTAAGYGTIIHGSPEIFKPNLEKAFSEELSKGQVYIIDQTSDDIPTVFVGRSSNVRAITDNDIYNVCEQVCKHTRMYRLTVTNGHNNTFIIPLYSWLDFTFTNYRGIVDKFRQDQINKLNFDHEVYTWLPIIAQSQIDHRDWDAEQIAKKNKCDLEVTKAILRKSISTLRNTDSTAKLKDIEDRIDYYKKLNIDKYITSLIDKMP